MSILIHFNNIQSSSPSGLDECDVFRAAALDTWYRIGFSRTRPRLKIHETTIAQNLVYELNLLRSTYPGTKYSIYESVDENTNGDDLELKVRFGGGQYITFAIQSKIIYHDLPSIPKGSKNLKDGIYPRIPHPVKTSSGIGEQIDLLLDYAKLNGYIPLYLFYNYAQGTVLGKSYCGISYDQRQYGCSIMSAQSLKNNFCNKKGNMRGNIKYSEIHPNWALPWFILACCFPRYTETEIFDALKTTQPNYQIRKEAEYIVDPAKWRPLRDAFTLNPNDYYLDELNQVVGFNPKFQIVMD